MFIKAMRRAERKHHKKSKANLEVLRFAGGTEAGVEKKRSVSFP